MQEYEEYIEENYNYRTIEPKSFATDLFSYEPNNINYIYSEEDDNDLTLIFEILVTIMMEGLEYFTQGLDNIDLDDFGEKHILFLKPWFQSIGFNIFIEKFDRNEYENFSNYYCRILINNRKEELGYVFNQQSINETYHFTLNRYYDKVMVDDISQIYTVFAYKQSVYKISFPICRRN